MPIVIDAKFREQNPKNIHKYHTQTSSILEVSSYFA
jgi:hypothetical protein